jgi:hypothetical protein
LGKFEAHRDLPDLYEYPDEYLWCFKMNLLNWGNSNLSSRYRRQPANRGQLRASLVHLSTFPPSYSASIIHIREPWGLFVPKYLNLGSAFWINVFQSPSRSFAFIAPIRQTSMFSARHKIHVSRLISTDWPSP